MSNTSRQRGLLVAVLALLTHFQLHALSAQPDGQTIHKSRTIKSGAEVNQLARRSLSDELDATWIIELNSPSVFDKFSNVLQQRSNKRQVSVLHSVTQSLSSFQSSTLTQQIKKAQNYEISLKQSQNQFKLRLNQSNKIRVKQQFTKAINAMIVVGTKHDVEELKNNPLVKRITKVKQVNKLLDQSVNLINVPDAWERTDNQNRQLTGQGVTVAVIDTGVDFNHPDLGGCFGEGCKVSSGFDFVDNDPIPEDVDGHGTHVAGIIAANGTLRGVAPDANIMAIKALDDDGIGVSSDIIRAIEYAVDPDGDIMTDDGANVINLSLGGVGSPDDPVSQAVDAAVAAGVIVVAAAGNEGGFGDIANLSPASSRAAITVGSVEPDGTLSTFSSKGPAVGGDTLKPEVLAPGGEILSLAVGNGQAVLSGTSMAAPHVAGVAALLKQAIPDISPEEVKARLISSAEDLELNPFEQGYGLVDAAAALDQDLIVTTANVFFGQLNESMNGSSISREIVLKNLGADTKVINLVTPLDLPEQIDWSLSSTEITLAPNASASVTLRAELDSIEDIPYPEDLSGSYHSPMKISSTDFELDLPVSFQRSLLLTIAHDNPNFIDISVDSAGGDSIAWNAVGPDTDEELFVSPGRYYITIDHILYGGDITLDGLPDIAISRGSQIFGVETYVIDITEDTRLFTSINNLNRVIGNGGRSDDESAHANLYTASSQLIHKVNEDDFSIRYSALANSNTLVDGGQTNYFFVFGHMADEIDTKLSIVDKYVDGETQEIFHFWSTVDSDTVSDLYDSQSGTQSYQVSSNGIPDGIENAGFGVNVYFDEFNQTVMPLQVEGNSFVYSVVGNSELDSPVRFMMADGDIDLLTRDNFLFGTAPILMKNADETDWQNYPLGTQIIGEQSAIEISPSVSAFSNTVDVFNGNFNLNFGFSFRGILGEVAKELIGQVDITCDDEILITGALSQSTLEQQNFNDCDQVEMIISNEVIQGDNIVTSAASFTTNSSSATFHGLKVLLVDSNNRMLDNTRITSDNAYLLIGSSSRFDRFDSLTAFYSLDTEQDISLEVEAIELDDYQYRVPLPLLRRSPSAASLRIDYGNSLYEASQVLSEVFIVGVDLDSTTDDVDGDGVANAFDADNDNDGLSDETELAFGLDPLNADDAMQDADGDGLTNAEEIALGTDLFDSDTDNDGVPDNLDAEPLVANAPDEVIYSTVFALPDINMDGGLDYALVTVANGAVTARIATYNGFDGSLIETYTPDIDMTSISALMFPDVNADDIDELAVFGIRNDEGNVGRPQLVVVDPMTGDELRTYNWPASWDDVSPLLLDDITGDGVDEVAIQGMNSNNGRPQLVVRNGATGGAVETFSFPDLFSNGQWMQLSDVTGDGVDDIGLVGNRRGNGKMQVRVVDATDRTNRPRSYNFGPKWDDTQFIRLSDTDGEGTDDWGMFGFRKDDGRPQLINKKGHDARGILRIHAWPSDMTEATFHRMPDMTGDGVDDVAVVGLRSNNRYQFNIKDGVDRAGSVANLGWPNNWDEVSFEVMDDLTGDDIVEIALFGQNSATGQWELIVKDGSTRLEVRRYSLGDSWDEKPQLMMLGDVSGDNVPDFMVYGTEGDTVSTVRYSGAEASAL